MCASRWDLLKPVSALGPDEAAGLRGLLFDLDDTLLSHGLLTREAYAALESVRRPPHLRSRSGRPPARAPERVRDHPEALLDDAELWRLRDERRHAHPTTHIFRGEVDAERLHPTNVGGLQR